MKVRVLRKLLRSKITMFNDVNLQVSLFFKIRAIEEVGLTFIHPILTQP